MTEQMVREEKSKEKKGRGRIGKAEGESAERAAGKEKGRRG
jgi:hypothetical protein